MSLRRQLAVAALLALGLARVAYGNQDAERAVAGFYAAYAGGSADAALDFLTLEARAAEGRRLRREVAVQCMRLHALRVSTVEESADAATVDAVVTLSRWSAAPGAKEDVVDERNRITLIRREGGWKISARHDRFADLASRIAQASPDERRALLDGNPPLRTRALGMALGRLVVTHLDQSRFLEAKALIDVMRDLNGELLDDRLEAVTLGLESIVARRDGDRDFGESRRLAEAGLAIAERTHDPDVILEATTRLVRTRVELDHADLTALHLIERAFELADYAAEPARIALLATQAARNCDARTMYRDALVYSFMAQRLAAEAGNVAAQLSAELNLAGTYALKSDFDLAEPHYRAALQLARANGYTGVLISTLADFAVLLRTQGRHDEAGPLMDEAIQLARQRGDPDHQLASLYLSQANVAFGRGDFSAAEESLSSSAADPYSAPEDVEYHHALLAYVLVGEHRYREALEVSATMSERTIAEAQALRALGRHAEAERILREIIDGHSRLRPEIGPDARQQSLFAASANGASMALIDVLVDCGDTGAAFAEYERMKGQVLLETIAHSEKEVASALSPAERASLSALNSRINEANRLLWKARAERRDTAGEEAALAQARLEMEEFEAALYAADPSRRWFVTAENKATKTSLPSIPGGVVIAFAVTDERTVAFAVTAEGRVSATIIPAGREALRRQAGELRRDVEAQGLRTKAKSRALYDLLIEPVESKIGGARLIGIIPDDVLWQIPFHALRSRDGRFLVERAAVFYAPSVNALGLALERTTKRSAGRSPRLFAVANPHIGAAAKSRFRTLAPGGSLDEIPEAEAEVRQIASLYGRNRSRVYIGNAATETVVKSEGTAFDVVHIATHGLLDDTAPMYSALLLGSADTAEDGLLEAREILDLRLHARVTVLSACDTGRGRVTPGEGVIGMSWALFAAGCPTSVVSLWKAESAATQTLMVEFHRHLIRGESPAVALRHAQMKLMRDPKTAHPMYWAPFVVVGAP
jgi:CHAT domain-containing protein